MPEVAKVNIKQDSRLTIVTFSVIVNKIQCIVRKATLYFYILDSFTNEDSTKLEEITTSVLKPTKNREERKERVKKYLQWVRTITTY